MATSSPNREAVDEPPIVDTNDANGSIMSCTLRSRTALTAATTTQKGSKQTRFHGAATVATTDKKQAGEEEEERVRLSARGVFLLVMAFVTFEAFAVCLLLELSHLHPSAVSWLQINASSLRAVDATVHSACLWVLMAAIPTTSVAAWVPGSIIADATAIQPVTHHNKKNNLSSPPPPHRDGYFQIFQLVAWTLYAACLICWSICPSTHWTFCALDYRTAMAVLAFIAEILIVSSILARERHAVSASGSTSGSSARKARLVVMVNNFNNMLLVVGAMVLALSAELARHSDDADHGDVAYDDNDTAPYGSRYDATLRGQYALSSGVNSVALVVTAVFNTYGLSDVLAPKAGWKFYQPFTGGAKFMLFQAISWTCFAVGIFIQALYLISVVIVEMELFVGAIALAGSLFVVSEVLMVMSLLVFKSKPTTTTTSTLDEPHVVCELRPFQQRLSAFTQDCLGAFLVGLMVNIQWLPSVLFVTLYAATTSLRASQILVYSLGTTLVELLIVVARSVAIHLYNQDSQYGKRPDVSEYRAKYLFPQFLAMVLPGYFTYTHFMGSHEATLPMALLSAFFYVYVSSYGGQPQITGSRRRHSWVTQRSEIMETVATYFNGKILREAPLDPQQHYIMGFHPHGIMSTSVQWMQFSQQWRDLFPGVHAHILTASVLHQIPLARDVLQFFGGREVSKQAFTRTLEHKESVMLVPGGQAEMLEQCSGQKQVRVYTSHKGFIRLAIEHGVPLVPVLSFKEGETMDNVRAPMVQKWFIKKLAFPFPYFPYGRLGLPIPRRQNMTIAVGAPLFVDQKSHPTMDEVDKVHTQYFTKIQELFEKYKDDAGCGDYTLQLI